MNDERLRRLLGTARPGPGCETGFAVMDRYAEALLRGENVQRAFPRSPLTWRTAPPAAKTWRA
jgi:hypothetical protein